MDESKLYVIKFGGSVLRDEESFNKAAQRVSETVSNGNKAVVVVSAIKGFTDRLMEIAYSISSDMPLETVDHILRLGEEQSTRLLTSALKLMDVDAVEVTPDSPRWPIITDNTHGDAEPILGMCREAARLGISPLLERGQVPVISGFVGRSEGGMITTLGRGGTDTTATILADCLEADKLVLVKDVGGVYSADPREIPSANRVESLDAEEAYTLASYGARILQDKVFNYKPDELDIRLVPEEKPLSEGGTRIQGSIPEIDIKASENPVYKLNLISDKNQHQKGITELVKKIDESGSYIHIIAIDDTSTTLVYEGKQDLSPDIHSHLKELGYKAMHNTKNLSIITIGPKDTKKIHTSPHNSYKQKQKQLQTQIKLQNLKKLYLSRQSTPI